MLFRVVVFFPCYLKKTCYLYLFTQPCVNLAQGTATSSTLFKGGSAEPRIIFSFYGSKRFNTATRIYSFEQSKCSGPVGETSPCFYLPAVSSKSQPTCFLISFIQSSVKHAACYFISIKKRRSSLISLGEPSE